MIFLYFIIDNSEALYVRIFGQVIVLVADLPYTESYFLFVIYPSITIFKYMINQFINKES